MARVTVEDCLEREENRFALVVLAATRTRQLMKGSDALVRTKNKPAVTSLREIAAGKVHFHRNTHEVVNEWVAQQHALNPRGAHPAPAEPRTPRPPFRLRVRAGDPPSSHGKEN